MKYREYKSDISDNFIIYKIDDDNHKIYMDNMYYRPENIKLFLIDLYNSIQDVQKICNDYYFVQIVEKNDWDKYLQSNNLWKKMTCDEYLVTIECKLENAFENIAKGLGIFENYTEYETII